MPRMHHFLSALINQNPSCPRCPPWKVCRITNETCFTWNITVTTSRSKLSYFDNRFYRAILCMRGICYGPVSVCLSVCLSICLSVTSRCSTKTANINYILHKQHHTIAQGLPSFLMPNISRNSTGITPCGAPNAGWVSQNRRLSTDSWLYLENSARQTRGFY